MKGKQIMDEKYALITTTTLTLLDVRFELKLRESGVTNKIKPEVLSEILNILDQSIDETEQQIHELYESREKGDRKDA